MNHPYKNVLHTIPLVRQEPEDTLVYVNALLHCLQHLDTKNGMDDNAATGAATILETACNALRFEAGRRLSKTWLERRQNEGY